MTRPLNIEVLETEALVAERAANFIAEEAKKAVAARGRFVMAVSNGHISWLMLRALSGAELPWPSVHIVQVAERDAPAGHPDRNLTHLQNSLLAHAPLTAAQVRAMPMESPDLAAAAANYAATLRQIAGSPPTLDLIQLCLGDDGHTASLHPGDPSLNIDDADVAITSDYHTRRRMTLTYPIINRSRQILWVVTDAWKSEMLRRLIEGDETIPAGRVRRDGALVLADDEVAAQLNVDNKKAA